MSASEIVRYQVHFKTWASNLVLEAASALSPEELQHDFGTSDKSIHQTLLHIYRAERIWLARIEGRFVTFAQDGDDQFSFLLSTWANLRVQWQAWSRSITDADCDRVVSYQDRKGESWTNSLTEIVLHVVNHSSHHRGQVSGFLRSLGKTPPQLDSIVFARSAK